MSKTKIIGKTEKKGGQKDANSRRRLITLIRQKIIRDGISLFWKSTRGKIEIQKMAG